MRAGRARVFLDLLVTKSSNFNLWLRNQHPCWEVGLQVAVDHVAYTSVHTAMAVVESRNWATSIDDDPNRHATRPHRKKSGDESPHSKTPLYRTDFVYFLGGKY